MTRRRSPFAPAPTAKPATERQDAFLDAIRALTAELERGPSTAEVAARMGIGKTGARKQLHALEHKGLIADVPKTVRSGTWGLTK